MDEKDIVVRLGRPTKIILEPGERMRSRAWLCSSCGAGTEWDEPIPAPAPCPKCGGIFFESVDPPPQQ